MRKKLGQHFLNDEKVLRQISDLLQINSSDVIVEIGPGHGELTKYLLEANPQKVVAIEKDGLLTRGLKENFGVKKTKLEIIEGDALKEIKNQISKVKNTSQKSKIIKNLKVVGNIPYYITGYLLRILGELEYRPALIVLTVQKEVAERICAEPPKMNLLAASVQFWATPTIVNAVNRKAFNPPPEVDSAIIKLAPKVVDKKVTKRCYELIKIIFKQPRKTILNNLVAGLKIPKVAIIKFLAEQGINPTDRPQNMAINKLIAVSERIYSKVDDRQSLKIKTNE